MRRDGHNQIPGVLVCSARATFQQSRNRDRRECRQRRCSQPDETKVAAVITTQRTKEDPPPFDPADTPADSAAGVHPRACGDTKNS